MSVMALKGNLLLKGGKYVILLAVAKILLILFSELPWARVGRGGGTGSRDWKSRTQSTI